MRIISQDGTLDVPYENVVLYQERKEIMCIFSGIYIGGKIAQYSTIEKTQKAMDMLRTSYAGRFVTNADISDDFEEQLKELMKCGFGTVIVKDTDDSRVEFDNLNEYFQFPQDEDVEA